MKGLLSLLLLVILAISMVKSMEETAHHPHPYYHHHQGHMSHTGPLATEESLNYYLSSISSYLTTTTFYIVFALYCLLTFVPSFCQGLLFGLGQLAKLVKSLWNALNKLNTKTSEKEKQEKEKKKKEEEEEQSQGTKKGGDDHGGACTCICDTTSVPLQLPVSPHVESVSKTPQQQDATSLPDSYVVPMPPTASGPDNVAGSTTLSTSEALSEPTVSSHVEPVSEPAQKTESLQPVNPLPTEDQIASFLQRSQSGSFVKSNEAVPVKPNLLLVLPKNDVVTGQNNTAQQDTHESTFTSAETTFSLYGSNANETSKTDPVLQQTLHQLGTPNMLQRKRVRSFTTNQQAATPLPDDPSTHVTLPTEFDTHEGRLTLPPRSSSMLQTARRYLMSASAYLPFSS